MRRLAGSLLIVSILSLCVPANAQDREVPYWASIRSDEVYMRVGPSADYPIEWVYHRADLPLKVVRVREGWRLVQDWEGTQGWMSASLLSSERSAQVVGQQAAPMRDAPADNGTLKWKAAPGVVGKLGDCEAGWCEFDVHGRKGWVRQSQLWGAGEP